MMMVLGSTIIAPLMSSGFYPLDDALLRKQLQIAIHGGQADARQTRPHGLEQLISSGM